MGSARIGRAEAARVGVAHVIDQYKDHVGTISVGCRRRRRRQDGELPEMLAESDFTQMLLLQIAVR